MPPRRSKSLTTWIGCAGICLACGGRSDLAIDRRAEVPSVGGTAAASGGTPDSNTGGLSPTGGAASGGVPSATGATTSSGSGGFGGMPQPSSGGTSHGGDGGVGGGDPTSGGSPAGGASGSGGTSTGPCPDGTYSETGDGPRCTEWTTCGIGLEPVSPGSSTADVVCEPAFPFPGVSLGGQGNASAMVATDAAVYLAVRPTIDASPRVLRMSTDGMTEELWLLSTVNGGAIASLTTLGEELVAGAISFGAGFSPSDFSGLVVKFDDVGAEAWRREFQSDAAWVGPVHVASLGTQLFVARAHLLLSCLDPSDENTCWPSEDSELVLSSYDQDGALLWEQVHSGYDGDLEVGDFTATSTHLYVAMTPNAGVVQFDLDGTVVAAHPSAALGGGVPFRLAPYATGVYVLSREPAGLLEHLAVIDGTTAPDLLGDVPTEGSDEWRDIVATSGDVRLAGKEASQNSALLARLYPGGPLIERTTLSKDHASSPVALAVSPSGDVFVGGTTLYQTETFAFIVPWP